MTPSEAVRRELIERGIAPARVRAIHHGPGQLAALAGAPPAADAAAYGLYVGTLEPRKNLPLLLAAWERAAPPAAATRRRSCSAARWGWNSGELAAARSRAATAKAGSSTSAT